jgi:phage tail-like protein
MSVSGLGIAIEPLTYREGGDNLTTRKMPGQADFNPITLSRGLFATDFDNWSWMTNLFTAMYGGANPLVGSSPTTDFRTAIYINVLQHPNNQSQAATNPYGVTFPNQASIVQVSFKLFSAWISSLAYSDLDAGGNAVGVEQMTLNYEGFDMRWGGQFTGGFVQNPTSW